MYDPRAAELLELAQQILGDISEDELIELAAEPKSTAIPPAMSQRWEELTVGERIVASLIGRFISREWMSPRSAGR